MTRRLIDIDDDLLAAAQRELKTTGISETVRAALQHVAGISARLREVESLLAGSMEEMADPSRRDDAWR
jgi:Arc/MetJ family transcription regulator